MNMELMSSRMKFPDSLADPGNTGHGILTAVMKAPLIMTPMK